MKPVQECCAGSDGGRAEMSHLWIVRALWLVHVLGKFLRLRHHCSRSEWRKARRNPPNVSDPERERRQFFTKANVDSSNSSFFSKAWLRTTFEVFNENLDLRYKIRGPPCYCNCMCCSCNDQFTILSKREDEVLGSILKKKGTNRNRTSLTRAPSYVIECKFFFIISSSLLKKVTSSKRRQNKKDLIKFFKVLMAAIYNIIL